MSEAEPGLPVELRTDLAASLGQFTILSPVEYSFAGEAPIDVRLAPAGAPWIAPVQTAADDALTRAVQAALYERCYARRLGADRAAAAIAGEDPAFIDRLSQANAGSERWDNGWTIHQLGSNGWIFVRKGERERAAMPGEFISAVAPGMAPQIGGTVSLRVPREARGVQPGFYFAFGETLDEAADQLSLMRFYFHCTGEAAVQLVAALTRSLNRFQVPFQLKVLAAPALYGRTDAAVLSVGRRYFTLAARIVEEMVRTVPLDHPAPLFAKPLWPGVGVADDPGNGESFGTHRCRLAAQGIVDAWRLGSQDVSARLAAAAARFAEAGLDLARPYLGPGAADLFDLPEPARLP